MHKKRVEYGFLILVLVGIWLLNHFLSFSRPADYPAGIVYGVAKVTEVVEEDMGHDPDYDYIEIGKQTLRLEMTDAKHRGKVITAYQYVERTMQKKGKVGTKYIVASYDGFITTMLINYDRTLVIVIFTGVFLAVLVLLGKWKGIKSIFSLGFTLICVFFLQIPLILSGFNAIVAAMVVVVLSTVVTFVSISGMTMKSLLASLSCMICCLIAGIYALCFSKCTHISTLNTPEAENLLFITEGTGMDISQLLIAGILIASMGAIMDTSMSMVSSMFELKQLNPDISIKQLLKSGFNIGGDIMGTMTNTLILAFAGGSINSLFVYYMYQSPYNVLLNMDVIVIEMIRGLSGSIAVVCSIPVTVLLTAFTFSKIGKKRI